ncbi:MAG TPA: PAS domain S-box protein [Ornithinibacter sp.]|nr:PAS domain S-box protein [Ornithinibacter sp.]
MPDPVGVEFDERLAALLEAAPDPLVCVEPSGRIAQLNQRVCELFGYDREELVGAEVELLVPEAMRERHVGHRARFHRHPQVRSMGSGLLLVARRRDGAEIPVEVSLVPWLAGEQGWVVAAIRDVSGQRALEAASAESEARLRQIAESVDMAFLLLQLDPPAYLYVSPKARRLIGIDSESLVAADLHDAMRLVHPDDLGEVERGFVEVAGAGHPAVSEHRVVTQDGDVRWVSAVATPVLVPHRPTERTVITIEDITERVLSAEALRTAEAAARAANDSKNQFLSRMSHELRTPLNAVLGFGQLLSHQLAGTEHAEAVDYVLKGGQHLLDLINDVLDISRIESGQMSLSLETMNLATLVDETLQLMRPLASAAEVTLVPASGDPSVMLLADRQRVRQILLNLLSNAVKYNKDGGRVWVEWQHDDDVVRLTVRDEGPGIALELQGRVFQPFDRLGAESTAVEGAGIGLALTQSLAELMGGTVSVRSTPGAGATFLVTLPAWRGAQAEDLLRDIPDVRPAPAAAVATRDGAATLLYIEDNAPNVRVVEHLLGLRPGWKMIHAALGGLGVELARAHHPDLVLLDLHLPDLSGREVLRALKRRDDTKDIPVVILSADASPGLATRLVDGGAERFLTKPLDFDVVLALLDDVTGGQVGSRGRADKEVRGG